MLVKGALGYNESITRMYNTETEMWLCSRNFCFGECNNSKTYFFCFVWETEHELIVILFFCLHYVCDFFKLMPQSKLLYKLDFINLMFMSLLESSCISIVYGGLSVYMGEITIICCFRTGDFLNHDNADKRWLMFACFIAMSDLTSNFQK